MRIDPPLSQTVKSTKTPTREQPIFAGTQRPTALPAAHTDNALRLGLQLAELLQTINGLQRLVTVLFDKTNTVTTSIPTSLTTLFQQLLFPSNQRSLIMWLQQGGERKALAALITQLGQSQSPLNQWLNTLPSDQHHDIAAFLRLAGEQRMPEGQRAQDTHAICLQWPTHDAQSIDITIKKDDKNTNKNDKNINSVWTIQLALPIGAIGQLNVKAQWKNHTLATHFDTPNAALLTRVKALSPLLLKRLTQLGIDCDEPKFQVIAQAITDSPATPRSSVSIKV